MKLRKLHYILFTFLILFPLFTAKGVSDKDMEQAKVIAAKAYLRWTNNGSGYLDDVTATSMADLESKLKAQEKENLKAFKSVNIPSDYAGWDKERFVQFWGTTFFTSPALSADGKRAKDRVKAKVSALNVAAPTEVKKEEPKQEEPKADEQKKEENPEETKKDEPQVTNEDAVLIPEPQEIIEKEAEVADSLGMIQAEETSMALSEREQKGKSNTWIYILILIVLVILVVWLMVYAANMMKKDGKEDRIADSSDNKKMKKELSGLEADYRKLRSENEYLKSQLENARAEISRLKASGSDRGREFSSSQQERAAAPITAAPRRREPEREPQANIISEVFLGRANPKGLFVRGDRRPNPDHTVFRLDTKDGIVGTFRFVETPEAVGLVLSNPFHYLAGGCVSENFEEAENAARVITDSPGTAILENGCWKVLRKSKIRFE